MSHYKRVYLPNHSYFFTVVTANRNDIFAENKNVDLLKTAFRYVQARKYFKIDAICVLPDHLHCIWTMQDDSNHSVRWQMIKTSFTREYRKQNPEQKNRNIWQPRYWEHVIRDLEDWQRHIDYLHYNPVKHGLVESVNDWCYNSFDEYCKQGYYEKNWGANEPETVFGMECE
jgi:putative transposase